MIALRPSQLAATLAVVAIVVALIAFFAAPPASKPIDAPAREFSAGRAMLDVRGLTAGDRPHPIGSADHERAMGFVLDRLRALGLMPSVQVAPVCNKDACDEVHNIVARIEGLQPGPALMLACHYDSVAAGPGAADDGAGVASTIEVVRALLTDGPPRHTIVVLVDDGEERGLLGARAFLDAHPWARDVRVVLNMEARGNEGQTAMFETSAASAWLVEAYGRAAARPTASSLIYTLYKALPNDTDLTLFKRAGMLGLNFAFADRVADYHTVRDRADRLDPRSVQHMGDQVLQTARALERVDLSREADSDAVWFDLLSLTLVVYRQRWVLPLALLGAGLAAWSVQRVRRSGGTLRAIAYGAAVTLAAIVAAISSALVIGAAISVIGGAPHAFLAAPTAPFLALVAASAAATSATSLALQRRTSSAHEVWAGGLVAWTFLSLAIAILLPGASYLFTLPALASALALLAVTTTVGARDAPWRFWSCALAPLIVGALLWLPIARVLLVMVGVEVPVVPAVPIALFSTLSAPILAAISGRARWIVPATAASVALVALAAASVLPRA